VRRRLLPAAGAILGLFLSGWSPAGAQAAGDVTGLLAGADAVDIAPPAGVPPAGYGGVARRLLIPDFLNRHPYAFWFKPGTGIHDPVMARALVLESGESRVLWLSVDLVAVEPEMVSELKERLSSRGLRYDSVILSASHTHSGPGAFSRSPLFGFLALDRLVPEIRELILNAMAEAAQKADTTKAPARVGTGRGEVTGVTLSRVGLPLDPEVGVLKVVGADDRPIALVWNYAIHGTALGQSNLLLSGDVMGATSQELEQALGTRALYTNGAVGDVSPAFHGWPGVATIAGALSREILATWQRIPLEHAAPIRVLSERLRLPRPRLSLRNCLGRWVPSWLTVGMGWAFPVESEMVGVVVGDSAWVTIPGELQTRLGQTVKAEGQRLFRHAFVVGLSNDYRGYFLTPEEYRRPGYIACVSLYGETGGRVVTERAIAMLRKLRER